MPPPLLLPPVMPMLYTAKKTLIKRIPMGVPPLDSPSCEEHSRLTLRAGKEGQNSSTKNKIESREGTRMRRALPLRSHRRARELIANEKLSMPPMKIVAAVEEELCKRPPLSADATTGNAAYEVEEEMQERQLRQPGLADPPRQQAARGRWGWGLPAPPTSIASEKHCSTPSHNAELTTLKRRTCRPRTRSASIRSWIAPGTDAEDEVYCPPAHASRVGTTPSQGTYRL